VLRSATLSIFRSYILRKLAILLDSLVLLLIVGLAGLSLTKDFGVEVFADPIELALGSDKILHFVAGIIVTLFVFRVLLRVMKHRCVKAICLSPVVAILLILGDEFSQLLSSSRSFSINDIVAGLFGVLIMLIILVIYQFLFCKLTKTTSTPPLS